MSYDSLANHGDYLSPYYLAEVLPRELKAKGGLRARWAERDKAGEPTPVKGLRALRREYFRARPAFANHDQRIADGDAIDDADRRSHVKNLIEQNDDVLRALGYTAAPRMLDVDRSGDTFLIPVAYAEQNVVAIHCGWAADCDAALDPDRAGRLLEPVEVGNRETIETGAKLARLLFAADEPPRYLLLLHGGVVVLADGATWGEGRYLAVSLDTAIDRGEQGELETIAALFSADVLQPPAEGGDDQLAQWKSGSRQHAVGVSSELREGLRESVQIIANEVLARLREHRVRPGDMPEPDLAKALGRQALRYLYRILFLLYAEARPELGILPADDQDYIAGYSMQRLGEIASRRLIGEEARSGFHLYESLALLFRMVNDGHNTRDAGSADGLSEGEGLRFESLKADLFDPGNTRLIGWVPNPRHDEDADGEAPLLDVRLRNETLYRVLRRLMLAKGGGGKGKTKRGGFISYAQLGINQLGAVYEGLMSYTGFIAGEELYEVAKAGDPKDGSWMIPASKADSYADEVFVMAKDENGFTTGERVRYVPGSFVYRLAGRDRQTSASYYTPQSLTSVTVELTLQQRIKEEGGDVSADDVLRWRVCEPALGSGAFLNEAINQLAALYLRKREEETGERLEPDQRALALQKVKAYIALHNCYGVDLNETAVELAEVSIWLNVMHRGLQAPWFGLHLVRGNALIGAGRRLYPPDKLAKGAWLKSAPEDVPFSAGDIPSGYIHHFLLPAEGWGCVSGEKEAKQLAPDDTRRLADWRKAIRRSPSGKKSIQRLQELADRCEYLWSLVIERLRISEREISRTIDVWRAEELPKPLEAIPRDKVLSDLGTPGTPFWRLKTVMDAWCALWFWPVDKAGLLDGSDEIYLTDPVPLPEPVAPGPSPEPAESFLFPPMYFKDALFGDDEPVQLSLADGAPRKTAPRKPKIIRRAQVALKDLQDWLDFAESVLGRQDIPEDSLISEFRTLRAITEFEDQLEPWMGMDSFTELATRFPWLAMVDEITQAQGFFHWELRFGQVFADGGFDIQVGNPPWVHPDWDESAVLAELEPWFKLAEKPPAAERRRRMSQVLSTAEARHAVLDERAAQAGVSEFLGSTVTYPLIAGTSPDFYRAFMIRSWSNIGQSGAVGLLHPDTHFVGDRERLLRAAAYQRLRIHGDFVNALLRFFPHPVGHHTHFGVHIYGSPKEIGFLHLSWLTDATELTKSLSLAEAEELPEGWDQESGAPGVRYMGGWDSRPHPSRVIWVDFTTLGLWQLLTGEEGELVGQTSLLSPVSTEEQSAITALASHPKRLGEFDSLIARGYQEVTAKRDGLIKDDLSQPDDWSEVVLKGVQIGLANPMFKSPTANSNDTFGLDLISMPIDAIPETEFRRAKDVSRYRSSQEQWTDPRTKLARSNTDYYRLAWRKMIAPNTERSLYASIIPPGPTHIDSMISLAMADNHSTALLSGFWASLILDYFVRITGKSNLHFGGAKAFPFGSTDYPLAPALLLRTMRLNCLTNAYADLWAEIYDNSWCSDTWACSWGGIPPLAEVGPTWEYSTPLRTERARRSALVEIDALVAVWLGMDVDALIAIYRGAFPVLNRYEAVTWFDATGWKLAGFHRANGQIQQKSSYDEFIAYEESRGAEPPPDGYTPPFYKADRENEYRQAHVVFSERLRRARASQGEGE